MPNDFIEMLKDIGGLKKEQVDPFAHWDDKTPCPYCPARYVSLSALDDHVNYVHSGREV